MNVDWLDELWRLHESHYPPRFDWNAHLDELNERLALSDRDQFALPTGLAPSWFVGDVESLDSENWALVVQLNQARRPNDDEWHLAQDYTVESYWDHWRLLNRKYWEPSAYRKFVRLASRVFDLSIGPDQESSFAASRLIFVELCPYPSEQFRLSADVLDELIVNDIGFQVAAEVRNLLIENASPSVILISGVDALGDFERSYSGDVELTKRAYPSGTKAAKELWHREGWYRGGGRHIPVVGFPFLRSQSAHNSYSEIDQLGDFVRQLLVAAPTGPATNS
jgi:hypothetical protein